MVNEKGWSIISVDFSPDSRWILYSSWSDYVHLYNTRGPPLYEALHFRFVLSRECHNAHFRAARAHRPRSGRFCLFSSVFSPDATEILAGASDACVYLYNLERKERTHRALGHLDDVNSVDWLVRFAVAVALRLNAAAAAPRATQDESGQLFASGSDDFLVGVWDRRLLAAEASLGGGDRIPNGLVGSLVGHTGGLTCVSGRGDGRYLLVCRLPVVSFVV